MKDYRHLLPAWVEFDPEDDEPMIDPPTPEQLAEFWQAVRAGSEAVNAYKWSSPGCDELLQLWAIDQRGQNFLHMAAATKGGPKTITLLTANYGRSCYMGPEDRGRRIRTDLHEKLPRQRDVDGNLPLHIAAAHDNLDFVKALIQYHSSGGVLDPVDVESKMGSREPMLSSSGREEVDWEQIRYILPLLDVKNKAGRTAAREAWFCGATRTAQWLDAYRRQYVGDDEPEDEDLVGEGGDESGTRVVANRCCLQ